VLTVYIDANEIMNSGQVGDIEYPKDGLVAYYPFNGNANDASGNGNNGILCGNNVPELTTDRFGNPNSAYEFGGYYNFNYIKVPNSETLKFDKQFTISFWILQSELGGMDGYGDYSTINPTFTVISKAGDGIATYPGLYINTSKGSDGMGLSISTNNNNVNSNSNHNFSYSASDYQLGEWLHVVLVIDDTRKVMYVNGKEVAQDALNRSADFSSMNNQDLYFGIMASSDMTLGGYGSGAWYPFYGKIDDIIIYNKALSDSEIKKLYGAEVEQENGDKEDENKENGYEYVDLGLSVKWATCNVGATKPEEYGDYFAWGETEPKNKYDWSTYKFSNGSNTTLTKYCSLSDYGYNGYTDSKTVLEPEDDAAHVNWGGNWRMPTDYEYDELLYNCTWTWITQNGVGGYLLTSNISGYENRSIFLPAAGFYRDDSISYQGSIGNYWFSSIRVSEPYRAHGLVFFSSFNLSFGDRVTGCPVRPVCP